MLSKNFCTASSFLIFVVSSNKSVFVFKIPLNAKFSFSANFEKTRHSELENICSRLVSESVKIYA